MTVSLGARPPSRWHRTSTVVGDIVYVDHLHLYLPEAARLP